MALSVQPSKNWSPNIKLHNSSIVDYESSEEKDASQYRVLWSNLMDKGKYLESTRYHKGEVLLLCWDEKSVDMATQKEVDDLKNVLELKFGYHATIAKLSRETLEPRGRKLQVDVNYEVAKFVKEHDGPNNLLIVYYAGHGRPGTRFGDLELLGQTSPNDPRDDHQCQLDRVVWNQTEELLKSAAADILEIFDCCYAGMVGQTKGDTRLFEFLAATKANATTKVPGKESFTSALIHALGELVDQAPEGRFTTSQLLAKITEHEHFPKDQEPQLVERGDSHKRAGRIMLHPIQRDGIASKVPEERPGMDQTKKYTVTLYFDFTSRPSQGNIMTLGKGMNEIFRHNNLEVLQPRWGGMKPSATARALNRFQAFLRRRRSSHAEKRPIIEGQCSPGLQVAPSQDQDLCQLLTPPGTGSAETTGYAASGSADSSGSMGQRPKNKVKRRRTAQNGEEL
ncbi:MAG: hypothetical protein Q9195_004510 [Heterodermia aff. obscurata]